MPTITPKPSTKPKPAPKPMESVATLLAQGVGYNQIARMFGTFDRDTDRYRGPFHDVRGDILRSQINKEAETPGSVLANWSPPLPDAPAADWGHSPEVRISIDAADVAALEQELEYGFQAGVHPLPKDLAAAIWRRWRQREAANQPINLPLIVSAQSVDVAEWLARAMAAAWGRGRAWIQTLDQFSRLMAETLHQSRLDEDNFPAAVQEADVVLITEVPKVPYTGDSGTLADLLQHRIGKLTILVCDHGIKLGGKDGFGWNYGESDAGKYLYGAEVRVTGDQVEVGSVPRPDRVDETEMVHSN